MRAVCYHKENPNAHKKEAGAGAISLKALDQQATPYDGTLGRIQTRSCRGYENLQHTGSGQRRGNDTHENSIFKGGINPYRNQSQRGAFRRWIDRKPEKSLKDSLELM